MHYSSSLASLGGTTAGGFGPFDSTVAAVGAWWGRRGGRDAAGHPPRGQGQGGLATAEGMPWVRLRLLRPIQEPLGVMVRHVDLWQPSEEPCLPATQIPQEVDSAVRLTFERLGQRTRAIAHGSNVAEPRTWCHRPLSSQRRYEHHREQDRDTAAFERCLPAPARALRAVAGELIWRHIVTDIAGLSGLDEQLPDHLVDLVLRSDDPLVSMKERREFGVMVIAGPEREKGEGPWRYGPDDLLAWDQPATVRFEFRGEP